MADTPTNVSRRSFLAFSAALAAAPALAACGGGGSSSGKLKFWDMPWGTDAYNLASKKIISGFKPSGGGSVTYQTIQWANFNQTFSSAVASGTNPAVSTGGGFQAFRFAKQGAIAYADDLIATMKSDGFYDDFLPGSFEGLKTSDGYAALPWHLDAHAWWYNKALLEKAGTNVPTTWDELLTAGAALKKIGVYGFSTGAGTGNGLAYETPMALMIGNGGGLYDEDSKLDVMNDRNVEAMEFMKEMLGSGIIDPASAGYTTDNMYSQWRKGKFGIGIEQSGIQDNLGGDVSNDLVVASPLAGPHGDKRALVVENNLMMYKKTPSQEASEELALHWLKGLQVFWDQRLINGLPVLQSIVDSPKFQARPNQVKMVKEYQPIGISYSSRTKAVGYEQSKIDGATPMFQFGQAMLSPKTKAKDNLNKLSNALNALNN